MRPAPGIHIRDLSLTFDGIPLFDGLSLDMPAGQTTCLLGPSGCGKSTLLKALAGRADLDAGQAVAFSSETAQIAWMSQNDLLLPWMTVTDNILLGARLRGQDRTRLMDTTCRLIAEAGLAGHEDKLPAALSGGMRQRVALLRTLMEDRPVILMDEPFSALDALTRHTLQNLAARLTAGATVVLVTHDPLEALRLGHQVVVLGGSPARIVKRITPQGMPPRSTDDPEVMTRYAQVLESIMQGAA